MLGHGQGYEMIENLNFNFDWGFRSRLWTIFIANININTLPVFGDMNISDVHLLKSVKMIFVTFIILLEIMSVRSLSTATVRHKDWSRWFLLVRAKSALIRFFNLFFGSWWILQTLMAQHPPSPHFSTKKKTAKHPITAAVPVNPVTRAFKKHPVWSQLKQTTIVVLNAVIQSHNPMIFSIQERPFMFQNWL